MAPARERAAAIEPTPSWDGRAHDVDDALLRLGGDPGPERKREVLLARLLGRGQRAGLVAEEAQRRLEVERRRVVRRGSDSRLGERGANPVALARTADEEVVDVTRVILRKLHELAEPELRVTGRRRAARLVPARELRQEDAQERGLQLVEAGVVADEVEGRLVARAVEGEELNAVGELLVARRHQPAVAEAEEVLRGVEAERRDRAVLCDARRTEGLGRVLEHWDAELDQQADVERAAEQMDRDDGARPLGHLRGSVVEVEIERGRVDLREDGRRTAARDRFRGRIERERGADHLVAGTDTERLQGEHQRIGAVCDPDRPLHAEVRGCLLLEGPVVRAPDEALAVEHLAERGLEPRNQRLVFGSDVNEWNRLHAAPL